MPKEEWGVKRLCPTTGKRFYDLGRDPIVSPYTGEVVQLDTGKGSRTLLREDKEKSKPDAVIDEDSDDLIDADAVLDDDDDTDVDLGDDVLDDDDDGDNVSLDDIADMSSDDDDN